MFNSFNYIVPEQQPTWRSAQEIRIAALKHEEQRIQLQIEEETTFASQAPIVGSPKERFLFFLTAPLQMLAALVK